MVWFLVWILLLPGQIYIGIDSVGRENRQSSERYRDEIWDRVKHDDPCTEYAVKEAFESLQAVVTDLLNEHERTW